MKKSYVIVYKGRNSEEYYLGGVYTSQVKAWDRRDELIDGGYMVKCIVVENNVNCEKLLNTSNFMTFKNI